MSGPILTRPRGDAIADVVRLTAAPVVVDDTMRPLDEVVAAWRASYVAGDEARPCACGGVVVASPSDPTTGVRDHQRTDRHRRWWTEVNR